MCFSCYLGVVFYFEGEIFFLKSGKLDLICGCSGGEKKYSCFCQRYGAGEKMKVLFILNIKSSRDLLYKKGKCPCESGFSLFL